jgi:hypothetical protein
MDGCFVERSSHSTRSRSFVEAKIMDFPFVLHYLASFSCRRRDTIDPLLEDSMSSPSIITQTPMAFEVCVSTFEELEGMYSNPIFAGKNHHNTKLCPILELQVFGHKILSCAKFCMNVYSICVFHQFSSFVLSHL